MAKHSEKASTEAEKTPASPAKSGRGGPQRFAIGINVIIQILLVAAIVFGLNWVSFRHFKRWDFSRNQKFALAGQTVNLLKGLQKPARAIVFFAAGGQQIIGDVTQLLKEYEYTAGMDKFIVEYVDPYRNITRAQELAEKYKFGPQESIVILDYDGRHKFVNAFDMAEFDQSGMMFGSPPTVKSFKGEQALTSALLEIVEEKQKKIYLVTGHGEPEPHGGQINIFREFMTRQNAVLETVNLNNVDRVPEDASALMIFGPRTDYSEREISLIEEYWNNKRPLFIMLSPQYKTTRLNEWLSKHGVTPRGDRVLRTMRVLGYSQDGRIEEQTGIVTSPVALIAKEASDIVQQMAGLNTQLLGPTQSLVLDNAKVQTDKLRFTDLLQSGEGFWGETEFTGGNAPVFFDTTKDHKGPLTLGVAIEKGAIDDPRVKVETGRMVVIGNADFITDKGLQLSEIGIDLMVNAINWNINREISVGIPPKAKEPVRLDLSEEQLNKLSITVIVLLPACVALIGFGVWWRRRS